MKTKKTIAALLIYAGFLFLSINVALGHEPVLFINPVLEFPDDSKMDVMDDCMSFPAYMLWWNAIRGVGFITGISAGKSAKWNWRGLVGINPA